LKHETNEWSAHVVPANELMVFVMGAPEDVKVNLIVVLPMA
jgi:hypothetical protein